MLEKILLVSMSKEKLKENAERYVELLSSYNTYMEALEKVIQKVIETRKELVFLEGEIEENRLEKNQSLTPMVLYKDMGLYYKMVKPSKFEIRNI